MRSSTTPRVTSATSIGLQLTASARLVDSDAVRMLVAWGTSCAHASCTLLTYVRRDRRVFLILLLLLHLLVVVVVFVVVVVVGGVVLSGTVCLFVCLSVSLSACVSVCLVA